MSYTNNCTSEPEYFGYRFECIIKAYEHTLSRTTTHRTFCLTYSSKKAWNNFWHLSANSSFTSSPTFSAVAVATSMLIVIQNERIKLDRRNNTTAAPNNEVHKAGQSFARKVTPRDVWRATFAQSELACKYSSVFNQSRVTLLKRRKSVSYRVQWRLRKDHFGQILSIVCYFLHSIHLRSVWNVLVSSLLCSGKYSLNYNCNYIVRNCVSNESTRGQWNSQFYPTLKDWWMTNNDLHLQSKFWSLSHEFVLNSSDLFHFHIGSVSFKEFFPPLINEIAI